MADAGQAVLETTNTHICVAERRNEAAEVKRPKHTTLHGVVDNAARRCCVVQNRNNTSCFCLDAAVYQLPQ